MTYPRAVRIREVGPRDGIQSEKADVSTGDKIKLIDALSASGLRYIEAISIVSPKAIPQMADAREVWAGIDRADGVFYSALVPNRKGAEIATELGVDGLQVFIAASDSYNLKNVRKTTEESFTDVEAVVSVAVEAGIPVEGTISTAFGCPYEGDIPPSKVVDVSRKMNDLDIATISYGDTTGMGTPRRVQELIAALRDALPQLTLNMHFHDTRGTGLANVLAALDQGVEYFDASIGGMGGSPFAEGATGNIATEDLVHMLADMQIETGVDLETLLGAGRVAQSFIKGELPSKVLKAGPRSVVAGPVAR
ncbi:MAG: hydroxymethylglutaryl-CoA lyase [Actinomycetota bacterium]|jgi:hydroxymethylglutaryl-CoA lyase|nr:hydroxymethylglutaryl-CoA lyase [Actinomycetota bacterium]